MLDMGDNNTDNNNTNVDNVFFPKKANFYLNFAPNKAEKFFCLFAVFRDNKQLSQDGERLLNDIPGRKKQRYQRMFTS